MEHSSASHSGHFASCRYTISNVKHASSSQCMRSPVFLPALLRSMQGKLCSRSLPSDRPHGCQLLYDAKVRANVASIVANIPFIVVQDWYSGAEGAAGGVDHVAAPLVGAVVTQVHDEQYKNLYFHHFVLLEAIVVSLGHGVDALAATVCLGSYRAKHDALWP